MTYQRVIPRDLFNESALLKCLGRLSVLSGLYPNLSVQFNEAYSTVAGFGVEQEPSSGDIYCNNIDVTVNGRIIHVTRSLNSRVSWDLWATDPDTDDVIPVFDDVASTPSAPPLSEEFLKFIEGEQL